MSFGLIMFVLQQSGTNRKIQKVCPQMGISETSFCHYDVNKQNSPDY